MASYDYLWWDNSQLHKDGGCGAVSMSARVCVRARVVCVHARVVCISVYVSVRRALPHQKIHLEVICCFFLKVRKREGGKGGRAER